MNSKTTRPYLKSLGLATIVFAVGLAALFYWFGSPGERAVEAITRLAMMVFFPALVTGFLAKRAPEKWPFYKVAVVYFAFLLGVTLLQAIGRTT